MPCCLTNQKIGDLFMKCLQSAQFNKVRIAVLNAASEIIFFVHAYIERLVRPDVHPLKTVLLSRG